MSSFDTIRIECNNCKQPIEMITKGGDPSQRLVKARNVTASQAAYVDGDKIACPHCQAVYTVKVEVRMFLVDYEEEQEEPFQPDEANRAIRWPPIRRSQ
jgi:hypothetical protein